tara:strand:- start:3317 stop:4132 length:816 start_codon:yes stop_codon:yes gene_type:complete
MSLCVVFCCNQQYFNRFKLTHNQLISNGKYNGTVCLIVGDDLKNIENDYYIKKYNIIIKYFPDLPILKKKTFLEIQKNLDRPKHWVQKLFQYHKFYLFHIYFKQWDYILYLDCGLSIFDNINPILNEKKQNTILANRDGVDNETCNNNPVTPGKGLKIGDQFVKTTDIYNNLKSKFVMNLPYFQTTLLLYDTKIIDNNTFNDINNLLLLYPISVTNDQGIIALYFTQVKPCWEQLRRKNDITYFYDYVRCVDEKYIMVKNTSNNWLHIDYN